jgi:8-hydroxy-5-deazaflavin:NADPH oxidoreductase
MSTYIGILGAGAIGQSFARQLLKAGYRVTISNSRGPESLAPLVRELGSGVQAGTVKEAASAEIVILAVPWKHLREVVASVPTWEGRIVVDATNPIINPGYTVADLGGRTSSEVVADLIPGARLVKAGNTLPAEVLAADPREGSGRRVIFVSGDDASAKEEFGSVLDKIGFAVVDLGGLVAGGKLQLFPGGPLAVLNLIQLP